MAFPFISKKESLLFATLNPVQLEAAAALMCMDLGLTVDFFTANSQDYIDVRGRLGKQEDVNNLIEKLSELLKHSSSNLNDAAKKRICNSLSLAIQCKDFDYGTGEEQGSRGEILFKPCCTEKTKTGINLLTLEGLQKDIDSPNSALSGGHLQKWLNKLEELFFNADSSPANVKESVFSGQESEFLS